MAKILGLDGETFTQSFKVGFKIVPVGLAWDSNKERQTELRDGQKDQIAEAVKGLSLQAIRELLD